MTRTRFPRPVARLSVLLLSVLLTAMLAGCGGGGDDNVRLTLEEDLALVQADLDAAQSELATTKETLATTQETLSTTETDLATAQAELATTKATLTTTEETLTTTEEDLVEANADLEDKEAELATTQADLTMAESDLDTAEEQLTTTRINLATANANLTNAQTNLMTAQADLTAAETDLQERTTELTTTQAELATAKANLTGEQADLVEARAALKMAQDDLTAETVKLLTAQADLKTAQDTLTTVQGTLTSTQTALTTARARVTTLEGAVTTLQTQVTALTNQVAGLQGQVQTGNTNLQNQLSEAQQATINARAGAYLTAISDGGTERTGVDVSYERGSRLMINPGGNFTTGSGAPGISGFTARTYKRQVGVSGEQTVFLYTNIQAAGTRAFWKEHGLEVADASNQAGFSPTPTAAAQYIVNRTDSTQASGVRVSGRFDGVSGTFTCRASDTCMGDRTDADSDQLDLTGLVSLPVDGERSFAGGTWVFKPSSITGGIRQNEDTEHLYFGIWVEEPNVASAAHDYEYIMRRGDTAFTEMDRVGLPGTASFRGGAVGKYVTRNQVGEKAEIGTFTAAADFTATFGGSPTLEGRLTNFRDGSQTLSGWSVHLGGGTADSPTNAPAAFAGGTVLDGIASALIGGVSAEGEWDATLYGNTNHLLMHDPTATPNPRDLVKYPLARYPVADLAGLVGNFHASSSNAALAGAFGATPR